MKLILPLFFRLRSDSISPTVLESSDMIGLLHSYTMQTLAESSRTGQGLDGGRDRIAPADNPPTHEHCANITVIALCALIVSHCVDTRRGGRTVNKNCKI